VLWEVALICANAHGCARSACDLVKCANGPMIQRLLLLASGPASACAKTSLPGSQVGRGQVWCVSRTRMAETALAGEGEDVVDLAQRGSVRYDQGRGETQDGDHLSRGLQRQLDGPCLARLPTGDPEVGQTIPNRGAPPLPEPLVSFPGLARAESALHRRGRTVAFANHSLWTPSFRSVPAPARRTPHAAERGGADLQEPFARLPGMFLIPESRGASLHLLDIGSPGKAWVPEMTRFGYVLHTRTPGANPMEDQTGQNVGMTCEPILPRLRPFVKCEMHQPELNLDRIADSWYTRYTN
jgi:hypothetical protein